MEKIMKMWKKKKSNDWVFTINCSVIFIFWGVRVRIKG